MAKKGKEPRMGKVQKHPRRGPQERGTLPVLQRVCEKEDEGRASKKRKKDDKGFLESKTKERGIWNVFT